MWTSFNVIRANTNMVTTLVGFRTDIAHTIVFLLLSKAGRNVDKKGYSCALLNEISEALECILLEMFNAKLHATQFRLTHTTLHKKLSLPLRIFSVHVTKSAISLMENFIFVQYNI